MFLQQSRKDKTNTGSTEGLWPLSHFYWTRTVGRGLFSWLQSSTTPQDVTKFYTLYFEIDLHWVKQVWMGRGWMPIMHVILMSTNGGNQSGEAKKEENKERRAVKETFINGILWEQIAANPSFDDALRAASCFWNAINNIKNGITLFWYKLQFIRDVHIKLHTQINQGLHSIGLALSEGHHYKVETPYLKYNDPSIQKTTKPHSDLTGCNLLTPPGLFLIQNVEDKELLWSLASFRVALQRFCVQNYHLTWVQRN